MISHLCKQRCATRKRALALSFAAHSSGDRGLLHSGETAAGQTLNINVLGFRKLLEAARQSGVKRLLWSSSSVVYGPKSEYPQTKVDEQAPCKPRSIYGLSKTLAEQTAVYYRDVYGLEVSALRLPLVFGPGLWYRGAAAQLLNLLASARAGERADIQASDQEFDLIYGADVGRAFIQLALHQGALAAVYNLAGFVTSYRQIIATVRELVPGCDIRFENQQTAFVYPLMNGERLEREIGFSRSFDLPTALSDYLENIV